MKRTDLRPYWRMQLGRLSMTQTQLRNSVKVYFSIEMFESIHLEFSYLFKGALEHCFLDLIYKKNLRRTRWIRQNIWLIRDYWCLLEGVIFRYFFIEKAMERGRLNLQESLSGSIMIFLWHVFGGIHKMG